MVEAPRGESVHYVITGEENRPERWRVRAPTYPNLQGVPSMLLNNQFADFPIIVGSIDPCFSCTDRVAVVDAAVGRDARPRPGRARGDVAPARGREGVTMSLVAVFVNVLLFLLLAPLFDGVIRKITARVQSRQGPPLVQPYYDLLKLLGKERVDRPGPGRSGWPRRSPSPRSWPSPPSFPSAPGNGLAGRVDVLTLVYLLTLGGVSVLLGALASRNTFAAIGASREMVTMIMVEPVLAMTLIMGAVRGRSLGLGAAVFSTSALGYGVSTAVMLVAYLAALQAFVAKQPFDIAEAEIEVLEGPFIEYSGPDYALFRYYMMMKQMVYAWLFAAVFLPFLRTGSYAGNILTQLLGTLLVFAVIALVGSTNPRLRIDQAVKIYAGLIVVALVAVGLAVAGI